MLSLAALFVPFTSSPWGLNATSPALKRYGAPPPQSLMKRAGKSGAGRIGFIEMESEVSFYWLPSTLPLPFFFFFQLKVLLVPCFNLYPNDNILGKKKKAISKAITLS